MFPRIGAQCTQLPSGMGFIAGGTTTASISAGGTSTASISLKRNPLAVFRKYQPMEILL